VLPSTGSPASRPRAATDCLQERCPRRRPVTRWMPASAAVAQDCGSNLEPASTEHPDGIVATIMAIGRGTVSQEGVCDDDGSSRLRHSIPPRLAR